MTNCIKNFNGKKSIIYSIKLFFFPFYPYSVFKQTRFLVILSVLFSLRFALQYAVIHIPVVSVSFSLAWTPLMIIGWVFGPVIGFFSGIITDTVSYLIKPTSLWFWMYALQEPMVGFISGVIGSLYIFRAKSIINNFAKNKKNETSIKWDLVINQIIVIGFTIVSTLIVLLWADGVQSFEGKSKFDDIFFKYSRFIIIFINIIFFTVVESITLIFFKNQKKNFLLFIWIVNLTMIVTTIFSFLLGPISAAEYYKYVNNGRESPNVVKYGLIFYLIPRVIKESVKLPLQDIALLLLIPITTMYTNNVKKNLRFAWNKS